jgi:choline dehydrogenase-like flavoprotein
MGTRDTDVLIIGAGAAGAIAAQHLAARGLQVLCLEQGEWPDAQKFPGRRPEREILFGGRWHANPNIRLAEADYPVDTSESDLDLVMFNGVGGSTVLWSALWHRLLPSDFRVQSLDGVARDWPISYEELAVDYDEVEAAMGVSGLSGDPAYPPRGGYPLPPFPIGTSGIRFANTMNELGWHWWPGTNAIASRVYRNLSACVRRGTCTQGCADGAKAATYITHWPEALKNGVTLQTGARVREIVVDDDGLASGVRYIDRLGIEHSVRARRIVLCANGIGTPRLLLLSRSERFPNGLANSSGLVGRGLMLHPTGVVTGVFDEPMGAWIGPMGQIAYSLQFYETDRKRGFVRGSKWSLIGGGGPVTLALGLRERGGGLHQAMRRLFGRTLSILIFAEDLPEEHNRVELNADATDSDGIPAAKVCYRVGANTRRLLEFNVERASEALKAAGAREILVEPVRRDFGGAHLMGTARMGTDARSSVVDSWGRTHDVPNLYIFDASVFPTAGAVNPTGTICALARRFAKRLAAEQNSAPVAI